MSCARARAAPHAHPVATSALQSAQGFADTGSDGDVGRAASALRAAGVVGIGRGSIELQMVQAATAPDGALGASLKQHGLNMRERKR